MLSKHFIFASISLLSTALYAHESNALEEAQATLKRAHYHLTNQTSEFMLAPAHSISQDITLTSTPNFNFPVSCHFLKSIADTGETIQMEDNSYWKVSASDIYVLNGWRREDNLVITPNHSWFSSHDYYITNKNDNTYVRANLAMGPLAFGPYSHWIVDIDYIGGHVFLENKMVWCIESKEAYKLKNWTLNDHVILGTNDSWFSHYNHILINVELNEFLRARQY